MQFKAIVTLTLTLIAAATASVNASVLPRTDTQCSTGPVQCCNEMKSATAPGVSTLLGLLGVVAGLTGQVGITCSPLTAIGVSGTNCNSQTVCCQNNSFNGVVALGCTPINIGL